MSKTPKSSDAAPSMRLGDVGLLGAISAVRELSLRDHMTAVALAAALPVGTALDASLVPTDVGVLEGSGPGGALLDWTASQAAVVVSAEAIAAEAAAEVAAEAAETARAAVEVAVAASVRATARAALVAAQALLAAEQAAGGLRERFEADEVSIRSWASAASVAAERVSARVTAVAAAAASAASAAQGLVRQQLVEDEAAMAAELLRDARGGDRRGVGAPATDPLVVADELRYGIPSGQLRLHYQPITCLATGDPVKVEALVRWQHPDRGLLGPEEFLEVAENYGLGPALGQWVLFEACHAAALLQDRDGLAPTLAVNVSGSQLSQGSFAATVKVALTASGCRPDRLILEVTETAAVSDVPAAVASLRELRQLGVAVALDDFGTGYAPLVYLKRFEPDYIKIDRCFVAGLGRSASDTAIVSSLIALAHDLYVLCIAEGVETVEQEEVLKGLGCDFAQGFLAATPTDLASLESWLDRHETPRAPGQQRVSSSRPLPQRQASPS